MPGTAGRDGAERPAELRVRLRVPAFELAHAAVEPDEQHLLLLLAEFLGDGGGEQRTDAPRRAEEPAARDAVVAGRAEHGAVPIRRLRRCNPPAQRRERHHFFIGFSSTVAVFPASTSTVPVSSPAWHLVLAGADLRERHLPAVRRGVQPQAERHRLGQHGPAAGGPGRAAAPATPSPCASAGTVTSTFPAFFPSIARFTIACVVGSTVTHCHTAGPSFPARA